MPPTAVADRAGRAVAERVTGGVRWRDARTVAVFASLPGEIPTGPLIQAAWTSGRRVLLPRVIAEGALSFHEHVKDAPLESGTFGVAEPSATAAEASLTEADLVFVPGLAFDGRGGRLGRGAGYYDRAIAEALAGNTPRRRAGESATIGLAFALQIVDAVPMEPHDVPLDAVVTESASFGDL
jgi:5-formyltetrahydrofolate cyclo-ligase